MRAGRWRPLPSRPVERHAYNEKKEDGGKEESGERMRFIPDGVAKRTCCVGGWRMKVDENKEGEEEKIRKVRRSESVESTVFF